MSSQSDQRHVQNTPMSCAACSCKSCSFLACASMALTNFSWSWSQLQLSRSRTASGHLQMSSAVWDNLLAIPEVVSRSDPFEKTGFGDAWLSLPSSGIVLDASSMLVSTETHMSPLRKFKSKYARYVSFLQRTTEIIGMGSSGKSKKKQSGLTASRHGNWSTEMLWVTFSSVMNDAIKCLKIANNNPRLWLG